MARVMVVDDEEMILTVMARVLADHEVVGERTNEEALVRLRQGELFDAIFVESTGAAHELVSRWGPADLHVPSARSTLAASDPMGAQYASFEFGRSLQT
jgi:hypothetical protein